MYGFNPTLGSDYFNKGSSNNSGSSNSDWKTDWNTVGDYSGLSGVPFGSFDYSSKSNSREDALSKAANWLAGTGRNKYTSQTQRSGQSGFMPQSGGGSTGGGSWKDIAPGTSVWTPPPTAPFTVAGGQSSGGGLGETLGTIAGIGGTALGVFGPLGPAGGAMVGKGLDQLFG